MTEAKMDLEKDIEKALAINDADLYTELREHPTKQFYYGTIWARTIRAERAQKFVVEALEAELGQKFRQEHAAERVTEKMLKEYTNTHPSYKEAYEKLCQLGFIADIMDVAKSAFETRGRLLLELAKHETSRRIYEDEVSNMQREYERRAEAEPDKMKID